MSMECILLTDVGEGEDNREKIHTVHIKRLQ